MVVGFVFLPKNGMQKAEQICSAFALHICEFKEFREIMEFNDTLSSLNSLDSLKVLTNHPKIAYGEIIFVRR